MTWCFWRGGGSKSPRHKQYKEEAYTKTCVIFDSNLTPFLHLILNTSHLECGPHAFSIRFWWIITSITFAGQYYMYSEIDQNAHISKCATLFIIIRKLNDRCARAFSRGY